jgi:hypothetical protein
VPGDGNLNFVLKERAVHGKNGLGRGDGIFAVGFVGGKRQNPLRWKQRSKINLGEDGRENLRLTDCDRNRNPTDFRPP